MARNTRLLENALIYGKVAKIEKTMEKQAKADRQAMEQNLRELKREQQRSSEHTERQMKFAQQQLLDMQKERQVRQEIFELRKRIGQWVHVKNPFQAFVEATQISRAVKSVPMDFLTDLESKKFHDDTCRCFPVLLNDMVNRIGPDLFERIKTFCIQIADLATITGKIAAGGKKARSVAPTLPERLDILERKLDQVEAMAEQIPGTNEVTFGIWPECRSYHTTIIQSSWRKLFLLKCAVLIVKADGRIEADERNAFGSLAEIVTLTAEEAEELLETTTSISSSELKRAKPDPDETLSVLIGMAASDGELAKAEKRMLQKIAQRLGVSTKGLDSMIASTLAEHEFWTLDIEKARKLTPRPNAPKPKGLFGKIATGLKDAGRFHHSPEELAPQRLEEIKQSLAIPEERTVLLIYETVGERAAMTDRHLHILPKGAISPGRIPLQLIDNVRFGFTGCAVEVEDKTATYSGMARDFFEIVKKMLDGCLKRVSG